MTKEPSQQPSSGINIDGEHLPTPESIQSAIPLDNDHGQQSKEKKERISLITLLSNDANLRYAEEKERTYDLQSSKENLLVEVE